MPIKHFYLFSLCKFNLDSGPFLPALKEHDNLVQVVQLGNKVCHISI